MQAAKRMQRYLAASAVLILATVATTAYAWQAPTDATPRVALLQNAKPVNDLDGGEPGPELDAEASPATAEINTLDSTDVQLNALPEGQLDSLLVNGSLPEEFDTLEPTVDLEDETDIGSIAFSTDITDDYQAIDPLRRFAKGYFTLYATFAYEQMVDGMVWSWVWRRNGEIIDDGNQVWNYGNDGPGYVYFQPEEGFGLGEYILDVWVNGEQLAQSNFSVIDTISAGN